GPERFDPGQGHKLIAPDQITITTLDYGDVLGVISENALAPVGKNEFVLAKTVFLRVGNVGNPPLFDVFKLIGYIAPDRGLLHLDRIGFGGLQRPDPAFISAQQGFDRLKTSILALRCPVPAQNQDLPKPLGDLALDCLPHLRPVAVPIGIRDLRFNPLVAPKQMLSGSFGVFLILLATRQRIDRMRMDLNAFRHNYEGKLTSSCTSSTVREVERSPPPASRPKIIARP